MQAASVNIQPSVPPSSSDRPGAPASPRAESESGSGASFRALLNRSVRDLAKREGASDPGKPAIRPQDPESGRALNRRRPLRAEADGATRKTTSNSRDPEPPRDPASRSVRRAGDPIPAEPAATGRMPDGGLAAAGSNHGTISGPRGAVRADAVKDGAESRAPARDRKASARLADEGAAASTAAVNPGPGPSVRRTDPPSPPEETSAESPGTVRRRSERKDAKVSVVDLRMRPANPEAEPGRETGRADDAAPGLKDLHTNGTRTAEGPAPSERTSSPKPATGTGFSDILARHLADPGAQDIVKAAQIVLRDGDTGVIRLRLEPESLGSVKIELKMSEKNITGRIVVETDEARSAFEKSLSGLRDAFTEGGFETASLEVSVGGGQAEGGEDPSGTPEEPFFTERLRGLERSQPAAADTGYARDGTVNLWA